MQLQSQIPHIFFSQYSFRRKDLTELTVIVFDVFVAGRRQKKQKKKKLPLVIRRSDQDYL